MTKGNNDNQQFDETYPTIDNAQYRKKKLWLALGISGAVIALIAIVALIIMLSKANQSVNEATERAEQAEYMAEIARSEAEFAKIDNDYAMLEGQSMVLANDSIIDKYAAAKAQIEKLLQELNNEKTKNAQQIQQLKAEIETLRTILREYTNRINELMAENSELRDELTQTTNKLNQADALVGELTAQNRDQKEKLILAEKINVTGLELIPLNQKRNKREKNITKAKYLEVIFNVSPNNTTAPGQKKIYARITSPEGDLLGNGPAFEYEGKSFPCSEFTTIEYANEEIGGVTIFWQVTSTLNPGEYHVDLFCDGYLIASKSFMLNKK